MNVAEIEVKQIVRPFHHYDSIPDFSTVDLLIPKMCHFVHVEKGRPSRFLQSGKKGLEVRRKNLDAKYRAMEPKIKAMRLSGTTWYGVSRDLKINYAALQYCKDVLGMRKYGEGR